MSDFSIPNPIDALVDAAVNGLGDLLGVQKYHNTTPAGCIVALSTSGLATAPDTFFFSDMEVPSELDFGKYQQAATHVFMGGRKTVDLYGSQSHPIELTGMLFSLSLAPPHMGVDGGLAYTPGSTAMMRAQELATLCAEGAQLGFYFDKIKFDAVVLDIKFRALHLNRIEYTLKLEVLKDNLLDLHLQGNSATAARKLNPFQQALQALANLAKIMTNFLAVAAQVEGTVAAVGLFLKTDPGGFFYGLVKLVPGSAVVTDLVKAVQKFQAAQVQLTTQHYPQLVADHTSAQPYHTMALTGTPVLQDDGAKVQQAIDDMLSVALNNFVKLSADESHTNPVTPDFINQMLLLRQLHDQIGILHKLLDQFAQPARTLTKLQLLNPNLQVVSQQYYGSTVYWQDIARASNLDPNQPIVTGLVSVTLPRLDQLAATGDTLTPVPNQGT